MKPKQLPKKDLEYVILFAEKLRDDPSLFNQQKSLIESQYKANKSLFKNMFGQGEEYEKNAREYLKRVGVLKDIKNE